MRKLSLILILSLILSSMYIPVTKAVNIDDYIYYNEFSSALSSEDKIALKPVLNSEQDSVIVSPSDNALLFRGNGTSTWTSSTSHVRIWLGEIANKPKLVYEIKFRGENFAGTSENIYYRTKNSETSLFFMNAKKEIYDKSGGTLITTLSDVTTWHTVKIIFDNDKDTDGKYYRTILIDGVKYPNSKVEGNAYAETGKFNISPSASLQTHAKDGDRKIYYDYIKIYEYSDEFSANLKANDTLDKVDASFSFDVKGDSLKKENITLISEDLSHTVTVTGLTKVSSTEYIFTLSDKLKFDTLYNIEISGVKSIMEKDLTGSLSLKTREAKTGVEDILLSGSDNITSGNKTIDIKYSNETNADFNGKLVYAQYKADGSVISVTDTDNITLLKEKNGETLSVGVAVDANCDKMLIYILNSDGTDFLGTYILSKTDDKVFNELITPESSITHQSEYSINDDTGELTLSVSADYDTTVTATVKKGNDIVYHNRINTADKKAEFKLSALENGTTYTYEYKTNGSTEKGSGEIVYYDPGYMKDRFDIFNVTEETLVVDGFLTEFENQLGIDLDTYKGYSNESGDKEVVLKSVIAQRKLIEPDKKYADITEVNNALKISYDLISLKNGEKSIEDLEDYLDNDTFIYYKDSMTNGIKGFIKSELKGKEVLTVPDLNTLFKDTMIFKAIEKGENYKITSGIIAKYHTYIGLDLTTYQTLLNPYAVDTAVHGKLYENYTLLKSAFDTAVSNQQTLELTPILPPPPVNIGGGGGGSPVGFSKPSENEEQKTPQYDEKPKTYFNDIEGFDWAKDAITKLAELGVVNGKADGVYAPSDTVTRAELVKMVISAFSIPNGKETKEFTDVNTDDWYYTFVNSAYDSGILKGIDDNTFSPDGFVTREMAATVLFRVCNFKNISLDANLKTFNDSENISEYAKVAVETLAGNSYINGYEDLTFKPQGNVTRAEIAVLINNLLK
ncbi:MAG: S-layer homology domain-containing protein [Ruminococcaceae bacterium]|nr:S-layer homology domain-containing protein [Oscillospiraceae bacterium]